MASRLGRRIVHFTNLPIKLLTPTTFTNIKEIALKTIPAASKIEIKRVLESLYGFEVEKVRTLNMEGKKKKRGGLLIAKPDYKKAYVTLRNPLSISADLYPLRIVEEEKQRINKEKKASVVDDGKKHWLDERKEERSGGQTGYVSLRRGGVEGGYVRGRSGGGRRGGCDVRPEKVKFPWTSMRSGASSPTSSR